MSDPQLEEIVIEGRAGLAAYFDADFRMVEKSASPVLAKVVFDDGGSAFYTLTPVAPAVDSLEAPA